MTRCPKTGKITYESPQRAWAAALRTNKRPRSSRNRDQFSRPYRCEHCHLWHITSREDNT